MSTQSQTPYDSSWYPVPKGHAQCPLCSGTGTVKLNEKELTYSWNKGRTHKQCCNCGGQTMDGKSLGYSPIDPATGLGCTHTYTSRNAGRCYNIYTCTKCRHSYAIDSGD